MSSPLLLIPALPFWGVIPGGLQVGMVIEMIAIIHPGQRLIMNFQSGPECILYPKPRDDASLHISIRDDEKAIVLNHIGNKTWGVEERKSGFPIEADKTFKLQILVEQTQFIISIDGNKFCTFDHRVSFDDSKFISMYGAGEIRYFGIENPLYQACSRFGSI